MSTAHSVELGGGDVEPTQPSELRQLWPSLLGKVNWCLSGSFTLNLSLSKVTVDCTGRKGVREAPWRWAKAGPSGSNSASTG